METFQYSYQNVIDGQGISIAITGMLIVFTALVLISLFITVLPRIVSALNRRYPPAPELSSITPTLSTDPAVGAAIGFALHLRDRGAGGRGS